LQSLNWYNYRLRSMSTGEVCWRLGKKLRQGIDRFVMPFRCRWPETDKIAHRNGQSVAFRSKIFGSHLQQVKENYACLPEAKRWKSMLVDRAERICANRLTLFDLEDCNLGSRINWNYEYKAKKSTPMGFAPLIDYRNHTVTGDCKFVWEPSRHQHLVILGRAYCVTGQRRYAEVVKDQIMDWIKQCPYAMGMNWRSPLELAIRIINWAWALELVHSSNIFTHGDKQQLLGVVYRHLWDISRNYSGYSSANNHLIGEAAGVFIGSSYFASLKKAPVWHQQSKEILFAEIFNQTYSDGGTREQAMGYHLFVLEFFLLAGLVARNTGNDFPSDYWKRLEKMFEYVGVFSEGGEAISMFGDCDDGYVLDLGGLQDRARSLLAVGAVIFKRSDFKLWSKEFSEYAYWLFGHEGNEGYQNIQSENADNVLQSRALPDSGYYLLQCGHTDRDNQISVSFDCGDLGYGPIAAHGHADALSFTLRAFGMDIFIDPGTYDYFTYNQWRTYFRSTRAHNSIVIDGKDQSEILGPFLWGRRVQPRCIEWMPGPNGGRVTGEYRSWEALNNSVTHRRTITLDAKSNKIHVIDQLTGTGQHTADFCLHLAEQCSVKRTINSQYEISCAKGYVVVDLDKRLSVDVLWGSNNPIAGWISRGYHRKVPTTTFIGSCEWQEQLQLETCLQVEIA